MIIKTIIIDDERRARAELREMLKDFPEIEVVDEARNSTEAIEKIELHSPDLIFLDIQMPGKSGFELLTQLSIVPKVIFTTAYDKYALKAFEANALDYLLKPIDTKRLKEAVQKLSLIIKGENLTKEEHDHFPQKQLLTNNDHFFIREDDKYYFVKLSDIFLFESVENYIRVYFGTNKPMILKSLNTLENRLDKRDFFRVSRKHIINLKWISKVEPYFNNRLLITLKSDIKVTASRQQSLNFRKMMGI